MTRIGSKILENFCKRFSVKINAPKINMNSFRFDSKDPYILEALPDNFNVKNLEMFNGKKLKNVCNALDNPKIVERYNRLYRTNKGRNFSEAEIKELWKKAFPNSKIPTDINYDGFVYLNQIPESIGMHYDAHGIAKGTVTDQLVQLNNILSNGINKSKNFFTSPLICPKECASGLGIAGGAYKDGSFILLSGKNKSLVSDGIETVIVNDAYYNIFDDLVARFPNIKFIKAKDCEQYFKNLNLTV